MQLNMTSCKTGTWTSNWGYIDGLKEGNNSGFSNCDDLHAGWWVLCEGKHECFFIFTFLIGLKSSMQTWKSKSAFTFIYIIKGNASLYLSQNN